MNIKSNPNVRATPLAQPSHTPTSTVKAPPTPGSTPTRSPLAPQFNKPTSSTALAGPEEHKHIEKTIEHSQPQHIQGNAQLMVEQQVALAMQTQALAIRIDAGSKAMAVSTQLLNQMGQQQVAQMDFERHQSISPLETPHQIGSPDENKLRQAEITHGKNEAQRQMQFSAVLMMPDPGSTRERMILASENMRARTGEATERFNITLQADPSKVGELNKHLQAEIKTINLLFQAERGHPEHLTPQGTGGLGQNPHRSELLGHTAQTQATIQMEKANHLAAMAEKESQLAAVKPLEDSIASEHNNLQDVSSALNKNRNSQEKLEYTKIVFDSQLETATKSLGNFLQRRIDALHEDTHMSSLELKRLMIAQDALATGKPVTLPQSKISNHYTERDLKTYNKAVKDKPLFMKEFTQDRENLQEEETVLLLNRDEFETRLEGLQSQRQELEVIHQQLQLMEKQTVQFDLKMEQANLTLQYHSALINCP